MKTTVYTPDSTVQMGWRIWPKMIHELAENREIIWRLIIRDISAKYRQSILGWLWAIILPVANALVFTLLRKKVINIADTTIPYVVYVFWGTTLWQLFAQSLIASSKSLVAGYTLVTKVNIPKETVVFSSFGSVLVDFLIRCLLSIVVFVMFGISFHWGMLLIPVILMPFFLFSVAVSFFVSLLNSLFRDVTSIIAMVTAFLMLATPGVIYPPSDTYPMVLFRMFNPVSVFVTTGQEIIRGVAYIDFTGFIIMSGISVILFCISWYIFHISASRITERI